MTPEPSFVKDLQAYDTKLRARWARHSERWFIERKMDSRHPSLVSEQPAPESASPVQRDLWEGWQAGYVHVLTVPRHLLHWNEIKDTLAKYDSWRQGGMAALNRQLDAEAEQWEQSTDKAIDNYVEERTGDAYDHIAWQSGRRVSTIDTPGPELIDTGMGYKIRDRRVLATP